MGLLNHKSRQRPGQMVTIAVPDMGDKPPRNEYFCDKAKKEACAAEGCMGSLAVLKGRSCICAALRPHMSYWL